MLYKIVRDTRRRLYCGPTAFCALTGETAAEALALFDTLRGETIDGRPKGVRGVSRPEMAAMFREFGWNVEWRSAMKGGVFPTLAQFCRENLRTTIVQIRGHYIAVDDTQMCDTMTKQPVLHADGPFRRSRVLSYMVRLD